jgi:hypothetical protein
MGKILNQDLHFENIPSKDRRSFAGIPRKVLLSRGTVLYRFVTYVEASKGPSWRLPSPFWLPRETHEELARLHQETDIAMVELVRGTMALAFDFNNVISGEMRAGICPAAYAFRGPIAAQPTLGGGMKKLARDRPDILREIRAPGGLEQVYLPNLEWGDLFGVRVLHLSRGGSADFLFDHA